MFSIYQLTTFYFTYTKKQGVLLFSELLRSTFGSQIKIDMALRKIDLEISKLYHINTCVGQLLVGKFNERLFYIPST